MLQFAGAMLPSAAIAWPVRNKILQSLPPTDFAKLTPHFTSVHLKQRTVINEAGAQTSAVYFIESGLVSRTVRTGNDPPFEVALDGNAGAVGLSIALRTSVAIHRSMVVMPVTALIIEKPAFERLMTDLPSLQQAILRYMHDLGVQTSQLSLCSTRHSLESRVARWLLLAMDKSGETVLPMTQDLVAQLLGVRRPGVTVALQQLEQDGSVAKGRGSLKLLNREKLLERACGCYRALEKRPGNSCREMHRHQLGLDTSRKEKLPS